MPRRDQSPRENCAKGEGEEDSRNVSPNAMKKFKDLARKLVNVPRREFQQEQERYSAENIVRRNRRRRRDSP
jgi:hypothetical protein